MEAKILGFQRVDARQRLAFHPFEESAARGRDESEIVRHAGMVERRDGIAAARDRDQRSFARQRRCRPRQRNGCHVERRRLERTERAVPRSEEHTSELQSLMRISYAVFCLKKKI